MDSFSRLLSVTSDSFRDLKPSQTAEGVCDLVAGGLIIGSLLVPGGVELDAAAVSVVSTTVQTYAVTSSVLEGAIAVDKGVQLINGTQSSEVDWDPVLQPADYIRSAIYPGLNTKAQGFVEDILKGSGLEGAGKVLDDICGSFGSLFSEPAAVDLPPPVLPQAVIPVEATTGSDDATGSGDGDDDGDDT